MLISEFAQMTGVSVRTLHYYDQIGLLHPACVDEQSGYRYYDENSAERMREILFYRELDFSLRSISEILSSPYYDKKEALCKQKKLLQLKKNRIEKLIDAIESAERGDNTMKNEIFENTEYESARNEFAEEARQKWGSTAAYKESQKKTADYSPERWSQVNAGLDSLFDEFSKCVSSGTKPESPAAQQLVFKLQQYITDNYYTCTEDILAGLGMMYIADERFRENIDRHGEGTAEFVSQAISSFYRLSRDK